MARLTTEEINRRLAPRNISLVGEYAGYYVKSRFRCPEGHEWDAVANNIMNGRSCRVCYENGRRERSLKWTRETVCEQLTKKGITFLTEDYKDTQTICCYRCDRCGEEWAASLHGVLHKTMCPACSRRKVDEQRGKRTLARLAAIGIQVIDEYQGQSVPVLMRCDAGHEWEGTPKDAARNDGCSFCLRRRQHTQESAAMLLEQLGFTLLGEYKTNKDKTLLRCPEGHEFKSSPGRVMSGGGCPVCNKLVRLDAAGANARLAPKNIVLRGEYNGTRHKSDFLCLSCGHEWATNANALLNSPAACPKCVGYSTHHAEECFIYIMNYGGYLTKIGVSINPERRRQQMRRETREAIELVAMYQYGLGNGRDALAAEQLAHEHFAEHNAGLMGFDGATELFRITPEQAADYLKEIGGVPVAV